MTGRVRWSLIVAAALGAGPQLVRAQTGQAAPPPPPPPAQQPPSGGSTAGSQGQSSSAQPSSPGASSQQVVVNPPQPVPPAAPPSSTTVVNPPPASGPVVVPPPAYGDVGVVVERRREKPNPLATVATDAAYGGVAGLLVGGGVALVQQGDNWGRDVMVGAGLGLILGAAVGAVHAVYDQQQYDRAERRISAAQRLAAQQRLAAAEPPPSTLAWDGLQRTARDPVISARAVSVAFQF
jgi:hypothetical protein